MITTFWETFWQYLLKLNNNTLWPSNYHSRCRTIRTSFYIQKHLKKFQSSTVSKCLNWNLPKHLSVIKQVYQIVAYSYEERAWHSKNEGTIISNNVSEFHRWHSAKEVRHSAKECLLYESIYIKFIKPSKHNLWFYKSKSS